MGATDRERESRTYLICIAIAKEIAHQKERICTRNSKEQSWRLRPRVVNGHENWTCKAEEEVESQTSDSEGKESKWEQRKRCGRILWKEISELTLPYKQLLAYRMEHPRMEAGPYR